MARSVIVRPFRRLTQAELDSFLEKAADILRGNVDHSEFRGYVFALLFFKRISDVYVEEVRKLTEQLGDETLAKDPKMHNFVVPEGSTWDEVARQSRNQVGTALNEAMIAIERANQPKFDGILTGGIDFNDAEKLPRAKLINLINHFSSQVFDRAHVTDDVFGNAYEYLIRNFASKAGKSSGEFYTPKEVAYLMAEIVEPQPGHRVCDWASGSGGLLLQCRNYLKRQGKDPDRLFLHAQESNLSTYNISRINMILHGVKSWEHRHGDSIRNPRHLDDGNKLLKFDRIVMNPPFSLEDWGYDDFQGGDPYGRFEFGMPPRNNGDYAWLQQVAKSLKDDGKAIIVMSQGVLFRGQPEQTEEEDGRNQSADAEYVIREGFVKADLIECVIVLPSKLFYGNSVPACLIVLNKNKPADRKNKILMIWASRHFQKANPQNLLRPSDLMRILVPWRAFGDLTKARELVAVHEQRLLDEEEAERQRRLQDIEDAYAPVLEPLPTLKEELELLSKNTAAAALRAWTETPTPDDPYFGGLFAQWQKVKDGELTKTQFNAAAKKQKAAYTARVKELKKAIKELEKLVVERDRAVAEVNEHAERETAQIREAAADLMRICSNPEEAARYFAVVDRSEIEENEFNLNLPRYVDTFEPEEEIPLEEALRGLASAEEAAQTSRAKLQELLGLLREGTK
jgi:type I restriction enzyme M protein